MAIAANREDDLKYKKHQIELYFSVHPDAEERAEYLKSAYQDRYTVYNQFGVPVLLGRFQIFRLFLRVRVDGEIKFDLVFFVFQVVLAVGGDGHNQLLIQKSGQLGAVRFISDGFFFG